MLFELNKKALERREFILKQLVVKPRKTNREDVNKIHHVKKQTNEKE